jgi:predicted amidohydrolase
MSRIVKIATCSVSWFSEEAAKAKQGDAIARAATALVEEAGRRGADIVCLPEYAMGTYRFEDSGYVPQRIPGPATKTLGRVAARYRMYVIAPFVEEAGKAKPFNTAVLLDRRGKIVGSYRKTHLCVPGYQEGECYLAGDTLPVFETDFGKIGITICMDIHYPEVYATLALKGAEIIFWPSGAMDYTGDLIESIVNARAVDNQVWFVCSHFIQLPYLVGRHYGHSRIVDPMGRIRADTGHFPGVAIAEVDLDATYPMWYAGKMLEAYPTMRETFFKTRRPELYGELTKPRSPVHWTRGEKAKRKRP